MSEMSFEMLFELPFEMSFELPFELPFEMSFEMSFELRICILPIVSDCVIQGVFECSNKFNVLKCLQNTL